MRQFATPKHSANSIFCRCRRDGRREGGFHNQQNIMGLDITYYRNLKKLDVVFDKSGRAIDPVTREFLDYDFDAYSNPDFPEHIAGVEEGYYAAERGGGFRAGSYGGYNQWREELAKLAGYPSRPEERYGRVEERHDRGAQEAGQGPFFELIYFSDCEGTIGPKFSAKLAKDFSDYQAKADGHTDEYWRDKYTEWRKAFEFAANNGAVSFH